MKFFIKFLATGLGSGYSPIMPGTAGTLVAAVLIWFFPLNVWQIILLTLTGVFICHKAELLLEEHDSPTIVFDEWCGFMFAVFMINQGWMFITAFLLFRFFDIVKPYPINKLQELPGGWGVMADDLAAGLLTRMILFVITFVI